MSSVAPRRSGTRVFLTFAACAPPGARPGMRAGSSRGVRGKVLVVSGAGGANRARCVRVADRCESWFCLE